MRPTVETTRDPLNVDGLPPTSGMELDYRTATAGKSHAVRTLLGYTSGAVLLSFFLPLILPVTHSFTFFAVAATVIFWAFADFLGLFTLFFCCGATLILPFLPLFQTLGFPVTLRPGWVVALAVLLSLFDTAFRLARRRPVLEVLFTFLVGPILATAYFLAQIAHTSLATLFVLVLVAVAFTAVFADAVATHFVAWTTANPRLLRSTRAAYCKRWADRFGQPFARLFQAARDIRQGRVTPSSSTYPVGFALIAVAAAVGLPFYFAFRGTPFAGFAWLLSATLALVPLALGWNAVGMKGTRTQLRLFTFALGHWLTYNSHETIAAGVWRSPWGSHHRRSWLACITLVVFSLASLPAMFYFPLPLLFRTTAFWAKAATDYPDWLRPSFPALYQAPGTPDVLADLRPHEQLHLKNLPEHKRDNYIDELAARRLAERRGQAQSTATAAIAAVPETWLRVCVRAGFLTGDPIYFLCLIISLLGCYLLPFTFFLAACYAVAGRSLADHYQNLEAPDAPEQQHELSLWDAHTQRLRESPHRIGDIRERDHLWLGTSVEADYPILLHRDILREHAWILGGTGSGKTALALAPLIAQLLRFRDEPNDPQPSLLILDLKGDRGFFHGVRIEAERAGIPFRFFTNERKHTTSAFNPFTQSHMADLTDNQRVQILLQALGLEYGEFYGGGYFSAVNESVLRRYLISYPEIQSFRDLADHCNDTYRRKAGIRDKEWEDAGHLLTTGEGLKSILPLNVTPADKHVPGPVIDQAIDMASLITSRQVVYFHLSSIVEARAVSQIAKLALYSLLTAAARPDRGGTRSVLIFIDEFQQIVSRNLEIILRQARSMGLGVILANQNFNDLTVNDVDLVPTVEESTRFKQFFSARSRVQREHLAEASGEASYELVGTTHQVSVLRMGRTGAIKVESKDTEGRQEQIGPRFRPNDLMAMTDRPFSSIIDVSPGMGYTQFKGLPLEIESSFHITRREYQERQAMPWPASQPGTFVPADVEAVRPPAKPAESPILKPPASGPPNPAVQTDFDAQLRGFVESATPTPKKGRNKKSKPKQG